MSTAPSMGNRTFKITADIERDRADTQGCIVTFGDGRSGFALYVLKDRLVFDYNDFHRHTRLVSDAELAPGPHEIGLDVARTADGGGDIVLTLAGAWEIADGRPGCVATHGRGGTTLRIPFRDFMPVCLGLKGGK